MKILGVSSNYHDASAAIVIDGELVATSAEERFSLIKHDPSFPRLAIEFCLKRAGIKAEELDLVAYHEEPEVKISRALSSAFLRFPRSLGTFVHSMRESISSSLWVRHELTKLLGIDPAKVMTIPHHLSHAAYAFLSSPFPEAAILTVDAVGEWTSTGLFVARNGKNGLEIEPLEVTPFPHSIGLVYSAFTSYLGFKANDAECSTMALAAFGQPLLAGEIRKIIRVSEEGTYSVDLSYFDFGITDAPPVTAKFISLFGPPRRHKHSLQWDSMGEAREADDESRRVADIAASLQLVTEEALLALAKRARRLTNAKNLCLSGGVAMNCVANRKLAESGIFEGVFAPTDPGDGGGAAGAALYAALTHSGRRAGSFSPYLGEAYAEGETVGILRDLDRGEKRLRIHGKMGETEVGDRVAGLLREGKIVGWFQGRFENGPRALGNRSILADPANLATARRLSEQVKKRASFRPYALSMTTDAAHQVFGDLPGGKAIYRWMQSSAKVKPAFVPQVRAGLHVDGSTRPQVLAKEDNDRFFALLEAFGRQTGRPAALLNTSFNPAGMPLVASPLEAALMFLRTQMDVLVLNDTVIEKVTGA